MKRFLCLCLSLTLVVPSFAEVICLEQEGLSGMSQCSIMSSADPAECSSQPSDIIEHTGAEQTTLSCSDEKILKANSSSNVAAIKKEYEKLCKKKAKAYKRALMGNLLKKGKVGQLLQAFFSKKRYSFSRQDDIEAKAQIDAHLLQGKSEQEIEDIILSELQKESGIADLKALAKEAAKSPEFQLGYHQDETVPVNVIVKTDEDNFCEVKVDSLPKYSEASIQKCEFCVEKNISSSFTNDCSYMINDQLSEERALKLVGAKKKTDYCNNSMMGEKNDLSEVETMIDRICDIAKSGMKPEFAIQTSRNLYNDKTIKLAAKRGEFIQKYIRDQLLNGEINGQKRCDLEDEMPEWLESAENFAQTVKVSHPYYEGAKDGDYGPSPYAANESDQKAEIDKFRKTLVYEKKELSTKNSNAISEKKKIEEENLKIEKQIKDLTASYNKKKKELEKINEINPEVFSKESEIKNIADTISQLYSTKNHNRQSLNDLELQISSFNKSLSSFDNEANQKISLIQQYYEEKNASGDGIDTKAWDDKLFNSFKMVRISGRAVKNNQLGVDPAFMTPAVRIALNSLVEVQNYTCVVEPIDTHKTSIKGVLKGSLKVVTALTLPVVAVAAGAGTVAAFPFTTLGSFFCEGCGNPGNIPPALRFANPRTLNLSKNSRGHFADDVKKGLKDYITWGGLISTRRDKKNYENTTEKVYEEEQDRKNK
jgi:hypothetical protein